MAEWVATGQTFGEAANANMVDEAVLQLQANYINGAPEYYGFDYTPSIRAIVEQSQALRHINRETIRPAVTIPVDYRNDNKNVGGDTDHRYTPNTNARDPRYSVPRREGAEGGNDFVWYIPEWSHPDFDPSITAFYNRPPRYIPASDPVLKLHPALRPIDQLRNPTEWAKRFGIHPSEPGGRSRLSPTLSQTRDPLQDYANQVNMLSDEARQIAIELSRGAAGAAGQGDNWISPAVLEQMMAEKNVMTLPQLRERLAQIIGPQRDNKMDFTTFLQTIDAEGLLLLDIHKNYIANLSADQDWQQVIFHGMTSDDLVWDNHLTMSDEATSDLDWAIHPIFDRDRWKDAGRSGFYRYSPRFVYNLNGERREWNAETNDDVWNAMQPALQLATRIMNSAPPCLEQIFDMTNRRKLPREKDARIRSEGQEPKPDFFPVYGNTENYEGEKYAGIEALKEEGYNWKANVWNVLFRYLRFSIGSAWLSPSQTDEPGSVGGSMENESYSYGVSWWWDEEGVPFIIITVSAELLWPLIMPQFSQTEKMVCSFVLATTILHEFAHAVGHALQLMTTFRVVARRVNGGDRAITRLLLSLGQEMWDFESSPLNKNEPLRPGAAYTELGYDFEVSLWGCTPMSYLYGVDTKKSRHLSTVSYLVDCLRYPFKRPPLGPGMNLSFVRDSTFPVEDFSSPAPIDWIAQFFSKSWWDTMFQTYGHEAMKIRPTNRIFKLTMTPDWLPIAITDEAFGFTESAFLHFIVDLFETNSYPIVAHYIRAMMQHAVMPTFLKYRWSYEIQNWENDIISPLRTSADRLGIKLKDINDVRVNAVNIINNPTEFYTQYLQQHAQGLAKGQANGQPLTVETIQADTKKGFERYFAEAVAAGGDLMRATMNTYNCLVMDIEYLQRMVFDYFSMNISARMQVYRGNCAEDRGTLGAAYQRMAFYYKATGWLAQSITNIADSQGQDEYHAHRWIQWAKLFKRCRSQYGELIAMLGPDNVLKPFDVAFRQKFPSVPSSFWMSRMDRYRVLMHREYVKMDPRLRQLVDECEAIVRRYPGAAGMLAPLNATENDVNQITSVLDRIKSLGQEPSADTFGPFDWKIPDIPNLPLPSQSMTSQPLMQPRPPTQAPAQNPFSNIKFGQPNVAAPPPARLSAIPPQNPALFQNTRENSPFDDVGGTNRNNIIFGAYGPVPPSATSQPTQFQPRVPGAAAWREAPGPFPNAYSTWTTTTEDVESHAERMTREAREYNAALMLMGLAATGPRSFVGYREEEQGQASEDEASPVVRSRQLPVSLDPRFVGQPGEGEGQPGPSGLGQGQGQGQFWPGQQAQRSQGINNGFETISSAAPGVLDDDLMSDDLMSDDFSRLIGEYRNAGPSN